MNISLPTKSIVSMAFAVATSIAALSVASAAEPLTLSQALSELDGSPRIERARSASEEASWKRVESYSGFLPTLNASGSHLFGKKFAFIDVQLPGSPEAITIPQIIPTTTYELNARWTVFDGLANVDRFKAAKAFEDAGQKDFSWTRFQSQREVVLLFYRALAAKTLKQVAEQNVKTLDDHFHDVRLFKQAGVSTNYDVLRVEVQSSEAKTELLNAEDSISISLVRLGDALGKDLEGQEPTGELPVLKAELIKDIGAADLSARSDVQSLQSRVEGYEQLADAAGKHWVPKFSVFGQFQEYNNRNTAFVESFGFRSAYNYGILFTWNLFDGLASYARDKQAVEQRVQAEKALTMQQIRAKSDVELYRRRFLYNVSVYQSRVSDVGKANETVRLAKEGRKAGTRTSSDLLDAELELFRSRAGVINAQMGAIESLINLELATGKEIYSFQ